jgi:hypothetical protein
MTLMILTPTFAVPCDECGADGDHVSVDGAQAFVVQLCPVCLATFVQSYRDAPQRACARLRRKRIVTPDQ